MKIEIWAENARELSIIIEAMASIQELRDAAAGQYAVVRTPAPDSGVMPSSIVTTVDASKQNIVIVPVSVEDATAALKSAYSAGVPMEKIVELLTAKNVARVPELSDEDRAEFVVHLRALERDKRGTP